MDYQKTLSGLSVYISVISAIILFVLSRDDTLSELVIPGSEYVINGEYHGLAVVTLLLIYFFISLFNSFKYSDGETPENAKTKDIAKTVLMAIAMGIWYMLMKHISLKSQHGFTIFVIFGTFLVLLALLLLGILEASSLD